jgi:hypothetical protein
MTVYQIDPDLNLKPLSPVTADFNGDGRLDLAVLLMGWPSSVDVLFGNGNGTFGSPMRAFMTDFSLSNSLAVGDFNNDSQVDLVFTNCNEDYVRVLLGNGNGSFTAQEMSSTGINSCPRGITVAEFNSDNNLDVVVVRPSYNNIGVLLGNGNGTFAAEITLSTGDDSQPESVAVGDFNGDDYLDITFINYITRQVGVFLGHGDGTFTAKKMFPIGVGARPHSIAAGDLNGDTHLDVVCSYKSQNAVRILFGCGNGTFGATEKFFFKTPSNFYSTVAVGDFNGDKHLDTTIGFTPPYTVNVLLGYGNGIFEAQTILLNETALSGIIQVAVADFNGDGCQDIVTTNTGDLTVDILLNT